MNNIHPGDVHRIRPLDNDRELIQAYASNHYLVAVRSRKSGLVSSLESFEKEEEAREAFDEIAQNPPCVKIHKEITFSHSNLSWVLFERDNQFTTALTYGATGQIIAGEVYQNYDKALAQYERKLGGVALLTGEPFKLISDAGDLLISLRDQSSILLAENFQRKAEFDRHVKWEAKPFYRNENRLLDLLNEPPLKKERPLVLLEKYAAHIAKRMEVKCPIIRIEIDEECSAGAAYYHDTNEIIFKKANACNLYMMIHEMAHAVACQQRATINRPVENHSRFFGFILLEMLARFGHIGDTSRTPELDRTEIFEKAIEAGLWSRDYERGMGDVPKLFLDNNSLDSEENHFPGFIEGWKHERKKRKLLKKHRAALSMPK